MIGYDIMKFPWRPFYEIQRNGVLRAKRVGCYPLKLIFKKKKERNKNETKNKTYALIDIVVESQTLL